MDTQERHQVLFVQLIASLHAETMHFLGKTKHPVTDKIERNLDAARNAIDMLEMLEARTRASVTEEERRFLQQVLQEVRLNYVEEAKTP
jgi:L-serine deaminase